MTPLLCPTGPCTGVLGRRHHVWLPPPHQLGPGLCPQLLPDDQRDGQHLDSLPAHVVRRALRAPRRAGAGAVRPAGGRWPEHLPPPTPPRPAGTSCGACWRWRGARASGRSRTTGRCSSSCCPSASTPLLRAARTPSAPCRPARATFATSWTTARSASTAWVSPTRPSGGRGPRWQGPGAAGTGQGRVPGAMGACPGVSGGAPSRKGAGPRCSGGGPRAGTRGCWGRGRAGAGGVWGPDLGVLPRGRGGAGHSRGRGAALGSQLLPPHPFPLQAVPSPMPPTPCRPPGCTAACISSSCLLPHSIPSCVPASPATLGGFSAGAEGAVGGTGLGTPKHTGGQWWSS